MVNRLEYNKVLKVAGINNPLLKVDGTYGTSEEVHIWNNLAIWFSGSYYTVMHGKIPLEVINTINKKYPNVFYTEENGDYGKFLDYAEAKNLKTYHIDTKEKLIFFLTEINNYLRKNGKLDLEVKYEDTLREVTTELLKDVNPSVSARDWMQNSEKHKIEYNLTLNKNYSTMLGYEIRNAIENFDNAVNPFISNVNLNEDDRYLKKVKVDASLYDLIESQDKKEYCHLNITDPSTGNETTYYRNPNGFSFKLTYRFGEEKYLSVSHFFSDENTESKKGEFIAITTYGDNENNIDKRLNVTSGSVSTTYGKEYPASLDEIMYIYELLRKATSLAKEITSKSLNKNKLK